MRRRKKDPQAIHEVGLSSAHSGTEPSWITRRKRQRLSHSRPTGQSLSRHLILLSLLGDLVATGSRSACLAVRGQYFRPNLGVDSLGGHCTVLTQHYSGTSCKEAGLSHSKPLHSVVGNPPAHARHANSKPQSHTNHSMACGNILAAVACGEGLSELE